MARYLPSAEFCIEKTRPTSVAVAPLNASGLVTTAAQSEFVTCLPAPGGGAVAPGDLAPEPQAVQDRVNAMAG